MGAGRCRITDDPRPHCGGPSPHFTPLLPPTVHALIFIARRVQHFLPSSIRVDLYLPTLLGDFSSLLMLPFSFSLFLQINKTDKAHNAVIIQLKDQR